MKYISVIIFALALGWSWNVIHSKPAVDFETHVGIQEKLKALIEQTIKAKKPSASDLTIEQLWTEPEGSPDKIKAHYLYTFKESNEAQETAITQISGEALLQKQPDDGSGTEKWTLLSVKSDSDSMVFEQGLVVTPGLDNPPGADIPATQVAPPSTPPTSQPEAAPESAPASHE